MISTYTLLIVIITVLVTIAAFNNEELLNKLILWPRYMDKPAEYYRLLTSGFIHADWMHLFFNMFALYIFGKQVETVFMVLGIHQMFIVMYVGAIVVSSLPSFLKNRHNSYYRALGASGGVSAIVFAFIYYAPWSVIYIWFIPVPAILGGIAYLVYSAYMSGKGRDNLGHDAHFWGAVFGFVFTFIYDPTHGQNFLIQLMNPHFSL